VKKEARVDGIGTHFRVAHIILVGIEPQTEKWESKTGRSLGWECASSVFVPISGIFTSWDAQDLCKIWQIERLK